MRAMLDRLAGGETTAIALVRGCLDRIAALDPGLRAFLRLNPRAEEQARDADRARAEGRAGPLCGIPVAVKDNLATAGLVTTCGSALLRDFVPLRDATVVARLREAGAIVLGKTNLDEFAMGSSTENSSFGPSRNPWDPARVPGGSSGGSAVAVACGMAPAALGSETGGSVRQPAAFCGVVGVKPTYGRVSRSGLVAFGSSLDQVGLLAGSVEDAAALLAIVAGPDRDDATAVPRPVEDYASACEAGVTGLRIGLPREYLGDGLAPDIAAAAREAAGRLAAAGAEIAEVSLPHTPWAIPAYYVIATAEASSNLARFDGVRFGRRVDPGAGLQAMYRATRGDGFGPEVKRRILLGTFVLSAGYHDAYYGQALRVRALLRRDFLDLFAAGFHAVLTPTTPTPAFRLGEKVSDPLAMYLSDVYTATANLAGLPALSIPVALSGGLPVGVQVLGPDFAEAHLFRIGAALERAFGTFVPPAAA
ncbi:MAG TPA: Asp-tRNA(Asn)/Glu-tRNA(Gln) amidotransferase subunit GatA [Candidatus Polarisedimenticolaceae bacterium]|nr:Asp-tRNA(Asn)/Glu-tRNA(Gln) amidotransferase subunit GatA [Candidatus Polarisedimenticolaceae bacterium]